ncbi:MAG: serine protease [Nitrosomonas sp. PRO4]|nr:serine protease [Nitrosomonas sp. PRO4]
MKAYCSYLFLLLIMFAAFPVHAEEKLSVDPKVFDSGHAERIILVTYTDNHINQVPIGMTNQIYRRRGDYGSSTWSKRIASSIETDYKLKILSQWPIKEIGEHCVVYLVDEEESLTDVMTALSQDERIGNVQAMNTFKVMADTYNDPYYRLQTNIHSINLAEIHNQSTGKNISIAIVDTGVDINHPDLKGQIHQSKDFVMQKSTDSVDIHGTAIAGVIAAKPNNGHGIVGIAPDSRVVSLKACWSVKANSLEAVCNSFTLALAINTAIEKKVDILNLSLTGPYDPLLARLIEKAIQQGIIIVASQADSHDEKSGFPAQQLGVIGVRSISEKFGQSGHEDPALVLSAPGEAILTTLPDGAYDFVSGNSLATAHVSGLTALLLQLKRSMTQQEVFKLLAKANEPTFYKFFTKARLRNKAISVISDDSKKLLRKPS